MSILTVCARSVCMLPDGTGYADRICKPGTYTDIAHGLTLLPLSPLTPQLSIDLEGAPKACEHM